MEKQTKKIDEIPKYATKCVNINIKGLFGHSDHEPNYLKMSNTFRAQGFYPDKLMVRYTDQGTQLQIEFFGFIGLKTNPPRTKKTFFI